MVDAAMISTTRRLPVEAVAMRDAAFVATVHRTTDTFFENCRELDLSAPPQSRLWVSTWIEANQSDAILVTVSQGGRTVFGFTLQAVRKGPFTIARVVGETHANGNFFPLASRMGESTDRACVDAAVRAVRTARPDVHALVFERLLPLLDGRPNPLLSFPSQLSPNVALSCAITADFQAVLDMGNGHRKRKRHRYQARKLEAMGEVRHLRPRSAAEVLPVIDAFLDMKGDRLRQVGIVDVFGSEAVRNFFRNLFARSAQEDRPQFVLDALEVGGKIRAVTGSSLSGDRIICDFAGFADDDSAQASPGDFLLFENIRDACAAGFSVYDLGVGDEPYKRSWCNTETRHHDVFVALSPIGVVMVAAQRAKTRAKAAIKGNARLWALVKAVRSRFARSGAAPGEPES